MTEMTEFDNLVMRDIMTWALQTKAYGKYENFAELVEGYWKDTLNTSSNLNAMEFDAFSNPLDDLNYDDGDQPYA